MTARRFVKKLFKVTCITIGIVMVLLTGFHFWFKAHARQFIEDLVESKSNGKVKLKVKKIHFNYFSRNIELDNAEFYNTDTITGTTAYHFKVDNMLLRVKAILPLVFKKQILIDSLTLLNPHFEVTRLRVTTKPGNIVRKDVSIPEEMGKVYSSIQDALKILKIQRFQIDNGTFTLVNKMDPGQLPLTVSNIHFFIDNLRVDSSKLTGNEKLLFSDNNIVFRSNDQNILFPDGRHRLSFSRFRINLKNKLVAFDSCTIAAVKGESSLASFDVFFDQLLLTNIDFDTLYKSEVIKADSVYCVNPKFNLAVEVVKKKDSGKPTPKLENIIKQLTGDLQLGFVVVTNADFNIKTEKNNIPSTFTFSNNNFEMQGLHVQQDAIKPITVRNFAMAIRNYENFIKDSSYSIKFDSVLFNEDHITLSNFLFNKLDHGKVVNTFSIPRFNLLGLSWDDLVFEKKLKAERAIMLNPHINFTAPAYQHKKAGIQNIFQSLGAVNEFIDLQQLDIVNGLINLKLKSNLSLQLVNATLSVKSQSLLESKKLSGIKNSLTQLQFVEGHLHAGQIDIELKNIHYTSNTGQLAAGSINVSNKEKRSIVALQGVNVKNVQVDEITGDVFADGVRWQKADVKINAIAREKNKGTPTVELTDVQGLHTTISGLFGGISVSTELNSISFDKLEKKDKNKLLVEGLAVNGKQLKVKDTILDLSIEDYQVTDNKSSSFKQIVYASDDGKIKADVSIPFLTAIPHIQPLFNGDFAMDSITLEKPVINIQVAAKNGHTEKMKTGFPKIDIDHLNLSQPKIRFTQAVNNGMLTLNWHGDQNASNFLQATELHANTVGSSISQVKFYLSDFEFTNTKGEIFTSGNGKLSAQLQNISLIQEENQPAVWAANVSAIDARDFRFDSLGKSKGALVMKSGRVNNLNLSSSSITSIRKLADANTGFQIQEVTGHYSDSNKKISWFNGGFSRKSAVFSLDSFSFNPALEKDSFIARQLFQKDYFTFKSGIIRIGPVDLDAYIRDKSLHVGTTVIDKFIFTDYMDKQLSFNAGIIKPMLVNMIGKIPQHFSVDTVHLTNAGIEYTEVSEKTKEPATVPVKRMSVNLLTLKNYNINPTDSLRIQATGYLMDTAWIRLSFDESYADTSGGFRMSMQMKPSDLTIFNSVLIPLASVKLTSGILDTLSLRAAGTEYLSLGEMKMFYHSLKVRLLQKGDESKRAFRTRLITFIANKFVVKNKNTSRTGRVFFIRNRERSAINYLIKIATSGVSSSIGASSNRKMLRKYKRELNDRNLPQVDFK